MQISGFEILEKLGEGGMATVYKALQTSLDRVVAIKILSRKFSTSPSDIEMFRREAQVEARLRHPGIVHVYDANTEKGFYYFVMEYVDGFTLCDWQRRSGMLTEDYAIQVGQCVADVLEYAWNKEGVIHCDIKPDNIMVDSDGTVKVTDLGLARTLTMMSKDAQDDTVEIMGTPQYMAPEQSGGVPDLDCRADIYSLGATLFHLVTGRMLSGEESESDERPRAPGYAGDPIEFNPRLSPPFCFLLEKMLALDRKFRHRDWSEVKAGLARVRRGLMPGDILPRPNLSALRRGAAWSRAATPGRFRHPAPRSNKGMVTRLCVAAGLVAVAAAMAIAVARSARRRSEHAPAPLPPRPTVQAVQPSPAHGHPPALVDNPNARDVFDDTVKWAEENPDEYAAIISRFEAAADRCKGTQYANLAKAEIRRVSEARRIRAMKITEQLKIKVAELIKKGQLEEAAAILEKYDGPLKPETSEGRFAELQMVRQLQEEAATIAEKEKIEEQTEQRTTAALDEVALQLLTEGIGAAQESLNKALADETLAAYRPRFDAVKKALDDGAAASKRIEDWFREHQGKQVTIQLVNRQATLVVSGVEDGKVLGKLATARGQTARVPIAFDVSDLAPRERLIRLGKDEEPGVPLVKGLIAMECRVPEHARKYFKMVDPVLSERLVARIDQVEADVSADDPDR